FASALPQHLENARNFHRAAHAAGARVVAGRKIVEAREPLLLPRAAAAASDAGLLAGVIRTRGARSEFPREGLLAILGAGVGRCDRAADRASSRRERRIASRRGTARRPRAAEWNRRADPFRERREIWRCAFDAL